MDYIDFSTYERIDVMPISEPVKGKVYAFQDKVLVYNGKEWIDITTLPYSELTAKQKTDLMKIVKKEMRTNE